MQCDKTVEDRSPNTDVQTNFCVVLWGKGSECSISFQVIHSRVSFKNFMEE